MASHEELITLAQRIADHILTGLKSKNHFKREDLATARNEWMKLLQLIRKRGLIVAQNYAKKLASDVTIRQNIKNINSQFAEAISDYRSELEKLTESEQLRVLGYVAWWLRILYADY